MSTQQLPRRDAVRFRKKINPKGFQVYGLQICLYIDPWLQDPTNKEYIALIIQYIVQQKDEFWRD